MRNRLLLIAVLSILLIAAGFWLRDRYGYVNPRRIYTEAERAELIEHANEGDLQSSWRLYTYYSFVDYSPKEMERWLTIGASKGDVRSIYSLAFFYVSDDSVDKDFVKAEYWADVLAEHDEKKAHEIRREIERVRREEKSTAVRRNEGRTAQ
jgi:TPR repeat protein